MWSSQGAPGSATGTPARACARTAGRNGDARPGCSNSCNGSGAGGRVQAPIVKVHPDGTPGARLSRAECPRRCEIDDQAVRLPQPRPWSPLALPGQAQTTRRRRSQAFAPSRSPARQLGAGDGPRLRRQRTSTGARPRHVVRRDPAELSNRGHIGAFDGDKAFFCSGRTEVAVAGPVRGCSTACPRLLFRSPVAKPRWST